MPKNMIVRACAYMVIVLGVTVGLSLMIDELDSDGFVAIWLSFSTLLIGLDYLEREGKVIKANVKAVSDTNLFDLFERIEE